MKKLFLSLMAFFWISGELAFATPVEIAPNEKLKPASETAFPVALSTPAAPYPIQLNRECIGGKVKFKFTIMEDGSISELVIIESPNDQLSRAVIETVRKKWRFTSYSAETPGRLVICQTYMSFVPNCDPQA